RKDYYEHFSRTIPCTMSLTTKIDITNIKRLNLKIYPALIFALTKTVNEFEEFRINKNSSGVLGVYTNLYPCYTYLKEGNDLFTNLWSNSIKSYSEFYESYIFDTTKYGDSIKMVGKENIPENSFPISMIPWNSFDGFNLNLKNGYDYYLPIFTFGKFILEDKKYLIPLAIQVHHAVCDGFHLCRFIDRFQEIINDEKTFLD
ncbi:CatA-like O-acetyltransferase, partial [Cetobacterium sp.]|uniref:CatA-like O-acetyltransferase n=1 Tax=Cetobacterium sp. TaxID=2071632 RepID=UPI003F3CF581